MGCSHPVALQRLLYAFQPHQQDTFLYAQVLPHTYNSICNAEKTQYTQFIDIFFIFSGAIVWQVIGCGVASLLIWLLVIFILRYMLKLLFMYKGWMYESRGPGTKISLATKLWLAVVKVLSGWNTPRLYSFQGSLPRLPLPTVEDTMTRVV